MVHRLALVAVIGLAASAVCMGAAAAIGGRDFNNGVDFSFLGERPRCEAVPGATATARDLDWDGSDQVMISVPGHVYYTPGSNNRLHASGDPQLLAHLRVRDGHVEMDCNGWHRGNLEITLPGQEFKSFGIAGSGNLSLQKLDQTLVKLGIAGSGDIKADGKVEHAEIRIAGSGDADLGHVVAQVVSVRISGSGGADIAPSQEADIRISGSGDVNLHGMPPQLETHISGSGRIHNIAPAG